MTATIATRAADDVHVKGVEEIQIETLATNVDGQYEIDPAVEKRITRILDIHIMPWLFFMW